MTLPAAGSPRGLNLSLTCQRRGELIVSADITAGIPIRRGAALELRINPALAELSDELLRRGELPWYLEVPDGVAAPHCVTLEDPKTGKARRYMVVCRACYLEVTAAEGKARGAALAG